MDASEEGDDEMTSGQRRSGGVSTNVEMTAETGGMKATQRCDVRNVTSGWIKASSIVQKILFLMTLFLYVKTKFKLTLFTTLCRLLFVDPYNYVADNCLMSVSCTYFAGCQ